MNVSNLTELRSIAMQTIDQSSGSLVDAAKCVYAIPETGFNERKTSNFVQKQLEALCVQT